MRLLDPDGGADPRKMDEMVHAMVAKAIAGDVSAAAFIRDTLEGKPPQAIVGDTDEASVSIVFTGVSRAGDAVSNDDDVGLPALGAEPA
jgi:hypothetical protein